MSSNHAEPHYSDGFIVNIVQGKTNYVGVPRALAMERRPSRSLERKTSRERRPSDDETPLACAHALAACIRNVSAEVAAGGTRGLDANLLPRPGSSLHRVL